MTANPRALDVALATLGELSDDVRNNIRERGKEFVDKLNTLKNELGGLITKVQGTGLLFSRSEEHTSELQSLMRNSYAVFCLKKTRKLRPHNSTHIATD